jgi:flagellar hook assembly protein FlgD
VKLEVYNLLGQRVTTLVNKYLPAGDYTVNWESIDNSGKPVASGVYLYKIDAGKFKSSKKMILLK